MRWLALLGVVAAMAVAAWWFWPRDELVAVAPRPVAPGPTPVIAELRVVPAPIIPTAAEPSAVEQDAGPEDAGVIVHAIFEQVGPEGRVAGTRFFLQGDAGTATGLADMMGFARVDVLQGSWVVTCSTNCGHNFLAIVPGYEHFILPTVASFTVMGMVVDDTGAPVAGAVVSAGDLDLSVRPASARSRPDGTFTLEAAEQTVTLYAYTETTPPAKAVTPTSSMALGGDWREQSLTSEVEPMYTITLGGNWREQSPALMKLGDDPITIVAVPR